MPLALIAIGLVLLIASIRNKTDDLFKLVQGDFTGPGNFLYWIVAIGGIGAVGYFKPTKPIANAFLVLIVVIFLLAANKGGKDFFSSLLSQIKNTSVTLGGNSAGATPGSVDAEHPFGDYVLGGDLGASNLSALASQFGASIGQGIAAQSGG